MMSLTMEKAVILVGTFVATACFGIMPVRLVGPSYQSPTWKKAISLMSCFSGGVFVAACLLDLFPDVRDSVDNVLDEIEAAYHTKVDYPMAEFIIVIGFFLVLLIEQAVLEFGGHDRHSPNHAHRQGRPNEEGSDESAPLLGDSGPEHHNHTAHHILDHSSLRSVLLLIALTFHSVFEGLAIGLQQASGQLLSVFAAVIIHKAIMAFSLGLTIAQSNLSAKSIFASVLIFSLASPVGMAIGIGLTDMEQSLGRDIANGVLQGLSGGTFLYITFFEVLPSELNNEYSRMLKMFFILLGYSCVCGLLFITH